MLYFRYSKGKENIRNEQRGTDEADQKGIVDEGIRRGFWAESARNYLVKNRSWSKELLAGQLAAKIELKQVRGF